MRRADINLLTALLLIGTVQAYASDDHNKSGINIDLSTGAGFNAVSGDDYSYKLNGNTFNKTSPSKNSVGFDAAFRLGYKFSSAATAGHYWEPYLKYQLFTGVKGVSGVSISNSGVPTYTFDKATINDVTLGLGFGYYFTPKIYTEIALGVGGFLGGDFYSGLSGEANVKLGYDLTDKLSLFLQYNSSFLWNIGGDFASGLGGAILDDAEVSAGEPFINSLNVGLSYTF